MGTGGVSKVHLLWPGCGLKHRLTFLHLSVERLKKWTEAQWGAGVTAVALVSQCWGTMMGRLTIKPLHLLSNLRQRVWSAVENNLRSEPRRNLAAGRTKGREMGGIAFVMGKGRELSGRRSDVPRQQAKKPWRTHQAEGVDYSGVYLKLWLPRWQHAETSLQDKTQSHPCG